MDDPAADDLLTTSSLAKLLARAGGACASHRATINRWCSKGCTVRGARVKLRAVRQGSKWIIRWADFVEFRRVCTLRCGGDPDPGRTPAEVRRAARQAGEEMDRVFEAAAAANRAYAAAYARRKRSHG